MARRSRRVISRESRIRVKKYKQYLASNPSEKKSYREWKEGHYSSIFKRRYKDYLREFEKRKEAAESGRGIAGSRGFYQETPYNFKDFKETFLITRNTLEEEVEMGERERVGSVITEMINDQAYELSYSKARGVADYLIREKRDVLVEKGLMVPYTDEEGKQQYRIKQRSLNLLIRQGDFVKEEIGLWDTIKDLYAELTDKKGLNMSSTEAKQKIGQTFFNSK